MLNSVISLSGAPWRCAVHCLVWLGALDRDKGRARVPAGPRPSQEGGGGGFSSVHRGVSLEAQWTMMKTQSPGGRGLCKLRLVGKVTSISAPRRSVDSATL